MVKNIIIRLGKKRWKIGRNDVRHRLSNVQLWEKNQRSCLEMIFLPLDLHVEFLWWQVKFLKQKLNKIFEIIKSQVP